MAIINLEELIERKRQGEQDKFKIAKYESSVLGGDLELHKIPLKKYFSLMETESSEVDKMNAIIFESCPFFRDNSKALMDVYDVDEPTDLPSVVLEDQINELKEIFDKINSFYGLDKLDDEVKN